nr:P-loop NTPase fold protein [Actinomadura rayongensis]
MADAGEVAEGLAAMILSSRRSSPFALAVDAGWGMGKSTLLLQIEALLAAQPRVTTVRFNAWTAAGDDALEGVIKSVLVGLDRSVMRRWTRKLGRQRRLGAVAGIAVGLAARFAGVTRLVDELWNQLADSAKIRNDLRVLIHDMLDEWIGSDGQRDPDRALVVFIDDLDRCSGEVVVKICEAIKLYLDAPGLIFVLACDQTALARGVSTGARDITADGRAYLEKIVQVCYRMPPLNTSQLGAMITGYAAQSGTSELIDETVTAILAQRAGRNPRRIKRIINSFILEYQLDPAWRLPNAGPHLVTAVLLQQLYPAFYDLLVSEASGDDPIGEFLDYINIRDHVFNPPGDPDDEWWRMARQVFLDHRVPLPQPPSDTSALREAVHSLEAELPEFFPGLAANANFLALLRSVGDAEERRSLRTHLFRRPLTAQSPSGVPESYVSADPASYVSADLASTAHRPLAGLHIASIDDEPGNNDLLVQLLEGAGAQVSILDAATVTDPLIINTPPDALVSDITRGADPDGGFEHVQQLRAAGYQGPVIFYTGRITPHRRQRAQDLGAIAITTSATDVLNVLIGLRLTDSDTSTAIGVSMDKSWS